MTGLGWMRFFFSQPSQVVFKWKTQRFQTGSSVHARIIPTLRLQAGARESLWVWSCYGLYQVLGQSGLHNETLSQEQSKQQMFQGSVYFLVVGYLLSRCETLSLIPSIISQQQPNSTLALPAWKVTLITYWDVVGVFSGYLTSSSFSME